MIKKKLSRTRYHYGLLLVCVAISFSLHAAQQLPSGGNFNTSQPQSLLEQNNTHFDTAMWGTSAQISPQPNYFYRKERGINLNLLELSNPDPVARRILAQNMLQQGNPDTVTKVQVPQIPPQLGTFDTAMREKGVQSMPQQGNADTAMREQVPQIPPQLGTSDTAMREKGVQSMPQQGNAAIALNLPRLDYFELVDIERVVNLLELASADPVVRETLNQALLQWYNASSNPELPRKIPQILLQSGNTDRNPVVLKVIQSLLYANQYLTQEFQRLKEQQKQQIHNMVWEKRIQISEIVNSFSTRQLEQQHFIEARLSKAMRILQGSQGDQIYGSYKLYDEVIASLRTEIEQLKEVQKWQKNQLASMFSAHRQAHISHQALINESEKFRETQKRQLDYITQLHVSYSHALIAEKKENERLKQLLNQYKQRLNREQPQEPFEEEETKRNPGTQ